MEISSSILDASAQLGSLQKLPIDVRLLIWEKIFSDISESPISRPENVLSILYCSRFIYEEVSWHLYSGIVHEISIDSIYDPTCYMIARISSKRLERICKLKDSAAVRNHLFRFPHNRMKPATLHVNISHNSDPQLTINMWLKINSIVEILAGQDLSLKIHVKLIGQWLKQGCLRSFRFEWPKSEYTYIYDYDLAILPFAKLSHFWRYELPTNLSYAIPEEPDDRPHSMLHRMNHGGWDNVLTKDWLLNTRIFLEIILDRAPGRTLNLLRRDRFMNWFSASGSSAYEQQFIKDLEENYAIVQRHDPSIDIFSKRRSFLFFLYSMPSTEGGPGTGNHFRPWDSFEWYSKFPHGIRPFGNREQNNHLWFTGNGSRITKIPRFREFTEDLSWWMYNAKDLFAETEFPCKFFNCTLCLETGIRCRWCKKYDYRKRCGFCREGMTQHTGYLAWYNMWHQEDECPYWVESKVQSVNRCLARQNVYLPQAENDDGK